MRNYASTAGQFPTLSYPVPTDQTAANPAEPRPHRSWSASMPREYAYRICTVLLLGDWLAAFGAIFAGLQLRQWQRANTPDSLFRFARFEINPALIPWSVGGALLFVWLLVLLKTYETANLYRAHRWSRNLVQAALVWAVLVWAYIGLFPNGDISPRIGTAYCAVALVLAVGFWRVLSFMFLADPRVKSAASSRVIVVGWSDKASNLRNAMRRDAAQLSEIIGCVSLPESGFAARPPADLAVLGSYEHLGSIAAECQANSIILAESACDPRLIRELAGFCQRELLAFKLVPEYFPALTSGLQVEVVSQVPLLGLGRLPLDHTINRMTKRCMDIAGAVVGLILSAPIIAIFGAMVYFESPGPIFYSQRRTSRSGRTFFIYKIRSMRLNAESASGAVWCTADDPRRLRIGQFMRKYNIDELPQFWNVLIGDMSLVGPRPERPELIARFKDEIPNYNARHEVRTGLTGWAQIHGLRGDTDLTQRVQADLYYLENWNPLLDLYCLFATLFSFKNAH